MPWIWAALKAPVTIMLRLGINIHSTGSCMVDPTNHLEPVGHSRGIVPQIKRKGETALNRFLGGNSGVGMVDSTRGTAG